MPRGFKLQAAFDFMMSYGIALLIVILVVAIIYKTSVLDTTLSPTYCTGLAGFGCGYAAINSLGGVLTVTLTQVTGSPINVNGIACAILSNSIGDFPAYGNIYVTPSPTYYPSGWVPQNIMYSGTSLTFKVNCYGPKGIAAGQLGTTAVGRIWLNYTIQGYSNTIESVAIFSEKYT